MTREDEDIEDLRKALSPQDFRKVEPQIHEGTIISMTVTTIKRNLLQRRQGFSYILKARRRQGASTFNDHLSSEGAKPPQLLGEANVERDCTRTREAQDVHEA